MDPDLAGETLGPGVETGHVPMGPDGTYWFAAERAAEGQHAPDGELGYLREKFADWPEPLPTVLAATAESVVLRNDLYDRAPPGGGQAGPSCWSATRPTRCARTSARAAARPSKTPRFWPLLCSGPPTCPTPSLGLPRSGARGSSRWCVSRR